MGESTRSVKSRWQQLLLWFGVAWLWLSLVGWVLPRRHDRKQLTEYVLGVLVFATVSAYIVSTLSISYPPLGDAKIIQGTFHVDESWPRFKGEQRFFYVRTADGQIVKAACIPRYDKKCPLHTPANWKDLQGKSARMWVVEGIAVQMEIAGSLLMEYSSAKDVRTKLQSVEIAMMSLTFLWPLHGLWRYTRMFGQSASRFIRIRKMLLQSKNSRRT